MGVACSTHGKVRNAYEISVESIPGGIWEFFSSPPRPERLGGPSSLLSNGY
jgi:hypothetical protein